MAAYQSLASRLLGSARAFTSTGARLAGHPSMKRSLTRPGFRRPSVVTSASRFPSGGRGRGPPRQSDGFDSIGEEMKFDTTVGDEAESTLISDKRVSPEVVEALASHNITSFTPIQKETFDPLYDGRDMIGRSRTGTGKTLAFGLPICEVVAKSQAEMGMKNKRGRKPVVIILAPTRELAKQCEDQLGRVGKPLGLWIRTIYGGVSYDRQMRDLESGFDILVGTPGRIMDHLDRGTLSLDEIRHVILDEADEMLKMGFAEDIEKIFSYFDVTQAQVLLFSATTPSWVLDIARRYLKNPINVDAVGAGTRGATTIRHLAVKVPDNYLARKNILEDVIAAHSNGGKVIVFTQTKAEADELSTSSPFAAENTRVLHGDISQRQRELTLKQFRDGFFKVLIATDVAARGIDISEVDLVVQYKPPEDVDTYIHRSGRTGRAGRLGTSVVMYAESEWFKLSRLEKAIQIKFEKLGMPSIKDVVAGLCAGQLEKIKGVDEQVIPFFEEFASEMLQQGGLTPQEALARCMVAMTGRQLTVHRSVLTGQTGMTTIMAEARDPFREFDLFEHVRSLYDGDDRIHIPQVSFLWNKPNAAVFDLEANKAKLILAKSEADPESPFRMAVIDEMPRLDSVPFRGGRGGGRGGDRSYGGGRDRYGGGKSYGGDSYGRRDRGGDSYGGGSWKDSGSSRGRGGGARGDRRSGGYDDFKGGDSFGGGRRSSSPAGGRRTGGAGGGKKDESLDKFLESLDWP